VDRGKGADYYKGISEDSTGLPKTKTVLVCGGRVSIQRKFNRRYAKVISQGRSNKKARGENNCLGGRGASTQRRRGKDFLRRYVLGGQQGGGGTVLGSIPLGHIRRRRVWLNLKGRDPKKIGLSK